MASPYNILKLPKPTTTGVGAVGAVLNSAVPSTASTAPKTTPTYSGGSWRSMFTPQKPTAVASYIQSQQTQAASQPKPTYTPYKPFEYTQANIEADPEYQAALATANQNIQTSQNNTIAGLVANGQGNSSYSAGVAQQIANKEIANVNNNILPQLIQQAYQRHQQDFANQNLLDQQNYGVTQDEFNNGIQEGQLLGTYQSPEQRSVISQILALKQQAETPGITPQERAGLSSRADVLRDRLTALGGNASAVGANVAAANVNPNAGQRTLAGEQFDYGVGRDKVADERYTDETKYARGRDTIADQRYDAETAYGHGRDDIADDRYADELAYGRGRDALADTRYTDELLYGRGRDSIADQQKANGASQGSQVSPATAGSLLAQTLKKQVGVKDGKPVYGTITQPETREQAFLDVLDSAGINTWADAVTLLTKAGYTNAEIQKYNDKYNTPANFPTANSIGGSGVSRVTVPRQYDSLIAGANSMYGLPDGLLGAVASAESSFNPNARNSKSGAAGLFQFIPSTAKGYGIDPYDPIQAADAAGKMLSGLAAKYEGDYAKALAAYNWGGGNLDKAIKKFGNDWYAHAPEETQGYIKKILGG